MPSCKDEISNSVFNLSNMISFPNTSVSFIKNCSVAVVLTLILILSFDGLG